MTLDEFRATARKVDDLGEALGDDGLTNTPGHVYLDALYIAEWADDRHGIAPPNGPTHLLTLGNQGWDGPLDELEPRLFNWAKSEGYFGNPDRLWFIGHCTNPTGYTSHGDRRWVCPSNDYVDLFTDQEKDQRGPLPRGGRWVEYTS